MHRGALKKLVQEFGLEGGGWRVRPDYQTLQSNPGNAKKRPKKRLIDTNSTIFSILYGSGLSLDSFVHSPTHIALENGHMVLKTHIHAI